MLRFNFDALLDRALAGALRVFHETEPFEPVRHLLHRRTATGGNFRHSVALQL